MRFIILSILFSFPSFSFYLNTNIGAAFDKKEVKIYITSNSTCTNAGVDKNDILDMAVAGANKYWNRVPTSSLRIKRGGIYQTTDSKFLTEKLCASDSTTSCPSATSVPKVSDIVIACNSNTTDNFPSSSYLAISAPTNISGSDINGSIILINDSSNTTFATLSTEEMISVLAHEIGHAVGLGHSERDEAMMHYLKNEDRRKLAQDDIDGISYLYPNQFDSCNNFLGLNISDSKSNNNSNSSFMGSFILGLSLCFLYSFLMIIFTRRSNLARLISK